MHVPINVKSPNNISEFQMGFNSTFKGLINYDAIISYITSVFVFVCEYCCHRYLACKSHIFRAGFIVKCVLSVSTILYYVE
jgi:hypothetical protein